MKFFLKVFIIIFSFVNSWTHFIYNFFIFLKEFKLFYEFLTNFTLYFYYFQELGVQKVGHIKRLQQAIRELNESSKKSSSRQAAEESISSIWIFFGIFNWKKNVIFRIFYYNFLTFCLYYIFIFQNFVVQCRLFIVGDLIICSYFENYLFFILIFFNHIRKFGPIFDEERCFYAKKLYFSPLNFGFCCFFPVFKSFPHVYLQDFFGYKKKMQHWNGCVEKSQGTAPFVFYRVTLPMK